MVPLNQLDAVQMTAINEIVDDPSSNHLVKGFAGSGKTIVLTHVLERLASKQDGRRICFATYTHALKDMVESGLSDRALARIDISTFDSLTSATHPYDIIVADELQDLTPKNFAHLSPRYRRLIAAADFDQRIYRGAKPVSEIEQLFRGSRRHQLREIHRINNNVFLVATSVWGAHVPKSALIREDDNFTSVYRGMSLQDECDVVYEEAKRNAAPQYPSAILFPSKALIWKFISSIAKSKGWATPPPPPKSSVRNDKYGELNAYLSKHRADLQMFGSGSGEMETSDGKSITYLMTYHSSKGLDFPNVFLPHLTVDVTLDPMRYAPDHDERKIFFVAATRAKRKLFLSYHGDPHRFISEIDTDLLTPFKKPKRAY